MEEYLSGNGRYVISGATRFGTRLTLQSAGFSPARAEHSGLRRLVAVGEVYVGYSSLSGGMETAYIAVENWEATRSQEETEAAKDFTKNASSGMGKPPRKEPMKTKFAIKSDVSWDELISQCAFVVNHAHCIRTKDPDCQIVHVDLTAFNADGSADGSDLRPQVPFDFAEVTLHAEHD